MDTFGTCHLKYGEVRARATGTRTCGFFMTRAFDAEKLSKNTLALILGPVLGGGVFTIGSALAVFMLLRRRRRRAAADIEVVWGPRTYPVPRPPAGDPPDPFLAAPPEPEPGEHHWCH